MKSYDIDRHLILRRILASTTHTQKSTRTRRKSHEKRRDKVGAPRAPEKHKPETFRSLYPLPSLKKSCCCCCCCCCFYAERSSDRAENLHTSSTHPRGWVYQISAQSEPISHIYDRDRLASFPYLKIHQQFRIFNSARFRLNRHFFRLSLHFQLI